MEKTKQETAYEILKTRNPIFTDEHYGNSLHGSLKTVYIDGFWFDHTEIAKLGYGIKTRSKLDD